MTLTIALMTFAAAALLTIASHVVNDRATTRQRRRR
jgi:hypothetical protein